MTRDFEQIPGVASAAIGKSGDEPTFPFPEVLEVIELCSATLIAVLGLEMFLLKLGAYYASGCSDYDLQEKYRWPTVSLADWPEYVKYNNALAAQVVRSNPLGADHFYVLTTASWRECGQLHP